jgi:hypothetical protein
VDGFAIGRAIFKRRRTLCNQLLSQAAALYQRLINQISR